MEIKYSVVAEVRLSTDGETGLNMSYFKDGEPMTSNKPYRTYKKENQMDVALLDVNSIVIGLRYECMSVHEIDIDLLKLRVKNRLTQNLYSAQKNMLIEKIALKLKNNSLEEGYDMFIANAVYLRFKELNNFETMNGIIKQLDKL